MSIPTGPELAALNENPIDITGYELLDFGCSGGGGSIDAGKLYFRVERALGLDIDPVKIQKLTAAGYSAQQVDLANPIKFHGRVGYSTMLHFVEHLRSVEDVRRAIHNAIVATKKVIVVRYPWFDADGYLLSHGLKFVWSDWRGHTTSLNALRMWRILESFTEKNLIVRYQICGRIPIADSAHRFVVPLRAPIDTLEYDPQVHGEKKQMTFEIPVYQEQEALLILDPRVEPTDFKKLMRDRVVLVDSADF